MSSEANDPVVVEKNLPMRARDGVTLFADVYRPAVPGRFPVLVIRTLYDKSVDDALTKWARSANGASTIGINQDWEKNRLNRHLNEKSRIELLPTQTWR